MRDDELAQTAMLALDHAAPRLRVQAPSDYKGGPLPRQFSAKDSDYLVRVGTELTFMALVPHTMADSLEMRFTFEHSQLKRCFDVLFNRLGELQAMRTAGLIGYDDIEPYVRYWIGLLAGTRSTTKGQTLRATSQREPIYRALKLYLHTYGFSDVIELAKAFDKDLVPTEEDRLAVTQHLQHVKEHNADSSKPATAQVMK